MHAKIDFRETSLSFFLYRHYSSSSSSSYSRSVFLRPVQAQQFLLESTKQGKNIK
jgi:hypothetical protein